MTTSATACSRWRGRKPRSRVPSWVARRVVAVAVFTAPVSLPVAAIATAGALTYIGMGAADWTRASHGYCSGAQVVLDFSQAALFAVPGGAGVNRVGTALGTLGAGAMYLPLDAVVD